MTMIQLAPNLFVGPQITAEDLQNIANTGFTDVVCNRPDSEVEARDSSEKLKRVAQQLGLAFHYQPIAHGEEIFGPSKQLAQLAAQPETKVFAYCRSGARFSNAWTLAQAS